MRSDQQPQQARDECGSPKTGNFNNGPLYQFVPCRSRLLLLGVISGTFSFSLARRDERPAWLIRTLIFANGTWTAFAAALAIWFADTASIFGLLHFAAEVLVVGGLACLEWMYRHQLRFAR